MVNVHEDDLGREIRQRGDQPWQSKKPHWERLQQPAGGKTVTGEIRGGTQCTTPAVGVNRRLTVKRQKARLTSVLKKENGGPSVDGGGRNSQNLSAQDIKQQNALNKATEEKRGIR